MLGGEWKVGINLTGERILILALLCAAGGGLLLFYFIPKWRREDREKEEIDEPEREVK